MQKIIHEMNGKGYPLCPLALWEMVMIAGQSSAVTNHKKFIRCNATGYL